MKNIIKLFALLIASCLFAETTELLNSSSNASLDDYNYISNFEIDSDSGYFVKGKNLKINSTADGIEAIAWNIPRNISATYKLIPAYPSELNEANSGSGYIKNAAAIKSVKIVATLNRPYDDIYLLYSTSLNGEIKRIKMPHYDNAQSMVEQEYIFNNASYIDNVNNRNIKSYPLIGSYKQAIYFKGIEIQTNAPYGYYGYGDYSIVNIKTVAVTYDKAVNDEILSNSEEFEIKYGIDATKVVKEKAKNEIKQKILIREKEKQLMDKEQQ